MGEGGGELGGGVLLFDLLLSLRLPVQNGVNGKRRPLWLCLTRGGAGGGNDDEDCVHCFR